MGLSISAFGAGNTVNAAGRGAENTGAEPAKKNIFAGNLRLESDPAAKRMQEARNQAWKVISDAWGNDQSVDASIQARRDHYAQMEQLKKTAQESLADIHDDEQALKTLYGVADDSEEQQDLELLKKEQDVTMGVTGTPLTAEERARLMEIHQKPLTEYQSRALELNERAGSCKLEIEDAGRQMRDDTADIYRIELERLKSNPMLDAKDAADAIMGAANEEIRGMLVQDAMDYIDENLEEAEEAADKAVEEKKEREEQLDALKLKRAVQEALIEGTKEAVEKAKAIERRTEAPDIELDEMMDLTKGSSDITKNVGQNLDDIKSSMKVLEADLKGIKVDEEV